jgi:hypothetical protein
VSPHLPQRAVEVRTSFQRRASSEATIENPEKKAKYLKPFTLYIDCDAVYANALADTLERDLQSLVDGKLITRLSRHDTNPANNPQPPPRYRN